MSVIIPLPGAQYDRAHPLAQGIVAGWLLNEGSGLSVNDFVNNQVSSLSAPLTWVGSPHGGALKFDNSGIININSAFKPNITNLTICCWVKIESLSEGGAFVKWGNTSSGIGIGQGNTNFDNAGANIIILYETLFWQTSHATTLGWHFFCFVAGANNSYVYEDGRLRNTLAGGNPVLPSISTHIGGYSTRKVAHPIGMVRLYNRALTLDEIKMLYITPYIDFYKPYLL